MRLRDSWSWKTFFIAVQSLAVTVLKWLLSISWMILILDPTLFVYKYTRSWLRDFFPYKILWALSSTHKTNLGVFFTSRLTMVSLSRNNSTYKWHINYVYTCGHRWKKVSRLLWWSLLWSLEVKNTGKKDCLPHVQSSLSDHTWILQIIKLSMWSCSLQVTLTGLHVRTVV